MRETMNRKGIFFLLAASVLICFHPAEAQQSMKMHRIGFLSGGFPGPSHWTTTLRTDLRELGYVEGKNIAIESRFAENKPDRLPPMVDELVRLKVDVIVAGGTNDARAARNTTKTIPIVMAGSPNDPVEAGLVESLARPGGNVTGLTNLTRELGGKRLELLKEAVPKLTRVAVLYDPANPSSVLEMKEVLPAAARALKLTIQPWEVRAAGDLDRVFAALNKECPDGLYVPAGPLMMLTKNDRRLCVKEPITVGVQYKRSCRCRWAHVLRGGHRGQLPARRIFRGQNF